MPDAASLLPSNATELERDLSISMDSLDRLPNAGQLIRSSKRQNIPDSVVPWLIYEYGLGELLPFLTDPRTAIADGVLWQRLRGTPESFRIALGWIGNTASIEESEAGTIRWSQFQLGLAQAPADLSQTDSVVELSRLSSPVRSSLFRIYGGYDHRRFWLDDTLLSSGSWLADHTGVYLRDDWPQLSFGREHETSLDFFVGRAGALGTETIHTDGGEYEDRMLLSCSQLSELVWRTWHLEDLNATISRLHFTADGPWWQNFTTWETATEEWEAGFDWAGLINRIQPALKFAKAGLYLSDTDDALGDTNACFPAKYVEEVTVGAFVLSEGDPATGESILSEHKSTFTEFEILERIDRDTHLGLIHLAQYQNTVIFGIAHGVDYTGNSQLTQGNIDHPGVGFGPIGDAAGHLLGVSSASLVPNHREHQRTLAYDDVFRLDQHLLSEHPFLLNELAISREHANTGQMFSVRTGNWGQADWTQVADWVHVEGLVRHASQHRTQLYLSEDTILDGTHAVLGWPTSERYERDHYADATENRQSFTTRQHTRTVQVTWYRFIGTDWQTSTWSGDPAELDSWATDSGDWLDNDGSVWADVAWSTTDGWVLINGQDWDQENWAGPTPDDWGTIQAWAKRVAWDPAVLTIESVHQTIP